MEHEWYWCMTHEAAEPADTPCPPNQRMGPYPSREAAEHWKSRVAQQNEAWDRADDE